MKNILLFLPFLSIILGACVREEVPPCNDVQEQTQQFSLTLSINSSFTRAEEGEPFAERVRRLYYAFENTVTGEQITTSGYVTTGGEAPEFVVPLDNIPPAHYRFTAWGNLFEDVVPQAELAVLHTPIEGNRAGTESDMIYLGSQFLDLREGYEQDYVVEMDNMTGALDVELVNFPPEVSRLDVYFGPVYTLCNNDGEYSGSIDVLKTVSFAEDQPASMSTILAPSLTDDGAHAMVDVFAQDGVTLLGNFFITGLGVESNEVTSMRVNYDAAQNTVEVWVKVDGEWTEIRTLDVTEIE